MYGFRSAILGGYADTVTGESSYLFGEMTRLDADYTFMVDVPNIDLRGEISLQGDNGLPYGGMRQIDDCGTLWINGPSSYTTAMMTHAGTDCEQGGLGVLFGGEFKADMIAVNDGSGMVRTWGPSGNEAAVMGNGEIWVADDAGLSQAGMFVDASGNGIVWGDTKNARLPNPAEPGTDIWYACPEGPEAAAYFRGTAHLASGIATITPPDHFLNVASHTGITVQVTPLSADSKGLAVVEKGLERIVVRELFAGDGSYDFDYTVMAVRKGHEDYKVVRPSLEAPSTKTTIISRPRGTGQ